MGLHLTWRGIAQRGQRARACSQPVTGCTIAHSSVRLMMHAQKWLQYVHKNLTKERDNKAFVVLLVTFAGKKSFDAVQDAK